MISPAEFHEQGSLEWLKERVGHITSSRIADVISRTKGRAATKTKPAMPGGYTAAYKDYAIELIHGLETGDFYELGNFYQISQGKELEPDAIEHYAFKLDVQTQRCGFLDVNAEELTQHGILLAMGGSPDFLVWPNGGGEVKCPQKKNHTIWLGLDHVPAEHYAQCQANMWICEAEWWDFVSYNPTFPPGMDLIIRRTFPDESFIANMLACCARLSEEVLAEVERRKDVPAVILEKRELIAQEELVEE